MDRLTEILRPPGEGLLTVTTGSGLSRKLLGSYIPYEKWSSALEEKLNKDLSGPHLLGMPSDIGGGICRGAAHGPLHLREKLYKVSPSWAKNDLGDIPCIPHLLHDSMMTARQLKKSGEFIWGKNYSRKMPVSPLNILSFVLDSLLEKNAELQLLVLGGDHSISLPVFESLHGQQKLKNTAVIHFDAHTDFMSDRFGIDYCFSTWAFHALKMVDDPGCWLQVGIRASRHDKQYWEKKLGVRQVWGSEAKALKAQDFVEEQLHYFKEKGCEKIYITNDIDGTDSKWASATGTPEPDGLHPDWVKEVIDGLTREMKLVGADMVEVAPVIGSHESADKTLAVAVDYIQALNW